VGARGDLLGELTFEAEDGLDELEVLGGRQRLEDHLVAPLDLNELRDLPRLEVARLKDVVADGGHDEDGLWGEALGAHDVLGEADRVRAPLEIVEPQDHGALGAEELDETPNDDVALLCT